MHKSPSDNSTGTRSRSRAPGCLAAALLLTLGASAWAQEDPAPSNLNIVLGTKIWSNRWTTWGFYTDSNPANGTVVTTQDPSESAVSVIPQLSVRYKDFVGSVSGMVNKNYTFANVPDAKRNELDGNLGYYVLPGLAVTLGYKQIKQDFSGDQFKWSGPTVGFSATAPLSNGFSAYGSLGLGSMKAKLAAGSPDATGKTSLNAEYVLNEVGLAYSVGFNRVVRSMTITAGYRTQIVTTKDYATSSAEKIDIRDTTQGLTLAAVLVF